MGPNQVHTYIRQLPDAAQARRLTAAAVDGLQEAMVEDVLLLVSELVTNALIHASSEAGSGVELRVSVRPTSVRIAVRDESRRLPTIREPGPLEAGGRGMQIVGALADRWGVERETHGKVVWCELSMLEPSEPAALGLRRDHPRRGRLRRREHLEGHDGEVALAG